MLKYPDTLDDEEEPEEDEEEDDAAVVDSCGEEGDKDDVSGEEKVPNPGITICDTDECFSTSKLRISGRMLSY